VGINTQGSRSFYMSSLKDALQKAGYFESRLQAERKNSKYKKSKSKKAQLKYKKNNRAKIKARAKFKQKPATKIVQEQEIFVEEVPTTANEVVEGVGSEPVFESTTISVAVPVINSDSEPTPDSDVIPQSVSKEIPIPISLSEPELLSVPEPELDLAYDPEPDTEPELEPTPVAEIASESATEVEATPVSEIAPEPEHKPEPEYEPEHEHEHEPDPVRKLEPERDPATEPGPSTVDISDPNPIAGYDPELDYDLLPNPMPIPVTAAISVDQTAQVNPSYKACNKCDYIPPDIEYCIALTKRVEKLQRQVTEMKSFIEDVADAQSKMVIPTNLMAVGANQMPGFTTGSGDSPGLTLVKPAPKKRSNYRELRDQFRQKKIIF
jgi:hypothetical protein